MRPSPLLSHYLHAISRACRAAPALDLACGAGRNGLYLLRRDVPVCFADRDAGRLAEVETHLASESLAPRRRLARLWQVDFEAPGGAPLEASAFGAILVFRYLHRPLMGGIREALLPGGVLVYETFTVAQAKFGRPTNPDFLLREGELRATFADWQILHDFEGVEPDPDSGRPRAIAQLVAAKPPVP